MQISLTSTSVPTIDEATVEQWMAMPPTYETIVQRAKIAQVMDLHHHRSLSKVFSHVDLQRIRGEISPKLWTIHSWTTGSIPRMDGSHCQYRRYTFVRSDRLVLSLSRSFSLLQKFSSQSNVLRSFVPTLSVGTIVVFGIVSKVESSLPRRDDASMAMNL